MSPERFLLAALGVVRAHHPCTPLASWYSPPSSDPGFLGFMDPHSDLLFFKSLPLIYINFDLYANDTLIKNRALILLLDFLIVVFNLEISAPELLTKLKGFPFFFQASLCPGPDPYSKIDTCHPGLPVSNLR